MLEVEVLECEILVSFGLIVLVILTPCDLEHPFEGSNGIVILFIFLIHPAYLLIYQDGLLIVTRIFDQVFKKV